TKTRELLQRAHTDASEAEQTRQRSASGALALHDAITAKQAVLTEAEGACDRIRIALDFAEQRHVLRDDAPCPLCGSEQHPWKSDEQAAIAAVSEQQARVELLRAEKGQLDRERADL